MSCAGCYKPDVEGFCPKCRKKLFGGKKVSSVLSFDTPKADNLEIYQEKTKRLSISGVQLKYSLRLKDKELTLAEKSGQYILKPIPPSRQIVLPKQAPENEHLTMQIAEQVFDIETAPNALCRFADGMPAYITKRFDVRDDGTKHQQEDFSQISGRTKKTHGEAFKYSGSYEVIGLLIKRHVAAYPPILERFFKLVLFNYLFSNGDAHLRNFSLIRTPYGDYTLSPAYDLMCTVLHTPHESDTALDLFEGDTSHEYYASYGNYGKPHFEELAKRLGILPKRSDAIIQGLLQKTEEVKAMIHESYLSKEAKEKYLNYYLDKMRRMG
jgi:serine/threonine-protein kinase HipA